MEKVREYKVYVSSTYCDLKECRASVYRALRKNEKCDVIAMEDYVATDQRPLDKVLADVANCDIYVGIFAWRYGYIPDKENPERKSITELEYRKASEMRKPRLIFLLDKNATWLPSSLRDEHTGDGDWGACIAQLRQELGTDNIVISFQTCDQLASEVSIAVSTAIFHKIDGPPKPEGQDRHDLLKLSNKVKQTWVEGKLKGALPNEALIPLRMEIQMGTAENPWGTLFDIPSGNSRIIQKKEKKIGDIFRKASNSLLILGEPGSGKTIALLELARDLIAVAELNPYEPIPVVFHLSSWTDKTQSLVDWLVLELRSKYQIPERTARRWLQKQRITPLLDGLDEIKLNNRDGCVKAINEFSQGAGLTGLAVCSRRMEYERLSTRLELNGGILLLPLTPAQIEEYLASAGTELAAFRIALQTDEGLQSLAQSPLMLSVMRSAYKDMSVEQLTSKVLKESDRRQHLFDTYIDRMFELRPGDYASDKAIGWLSWLARKMTQNSQSIFLIEELQPSWLSTDRQFWYYRLSCHLTSGLLFGLSAALITLGFTGLSRPALIYMLSCFAFGLLGVPYLVIVKSLLNDGTSPTAVSIRSLTDYSRMAKTLLRGEPKISVVDSAGRILTSPASYIRTSEHLGWKWKDMIKPGVAGLKVGLVFGAIVGLFEMIGFIQGELSLREVAYHSLSDVMLGGILFMGLLGLFLGVSSRISTEKTTPNEGISLSLKNACSLGMTSAVIIGVVVFLYQAKPGTNFVPWNHELLDGLGKYKYGLFQAMVAGTFFGQTVAMIYGGYSVIMHYVLRFFVRCRGQAPLRYRKFLDYATDCIFLQKVGGGYMFIHALLLAHFALKSQKGVADNTTRSG